VLRSWIAVRKKPFEKAHPILYSHGDDRGKLLVGLFTVHGISVVLLIARSTHWQRAQTQHLALHVLE
jgi:hypothetical protein